MNTIYELRNIRTGKVACQSSSMVHAVLEAKWRGEDISTGKLRNFEIIPRQREGWGGMEARSIRYMGPWPFIKEVEFARRWLRGDKVRALEEFFDTSMTALDKKRRELKLPQRVPKGLWDEADEEAINFMFDEGMTEDEIAQHFKRTKNSVVFRLRKSSEKSDRRAKYTKRAPPRYGKTRWPRKKEVQRKLD